MKALIAFTPTWVEVQVIRQFLRSGMSGGSLNFHVIHESAPDEPVYFEWHSRIAFLERKDGSIRPCYQITRHTGEAFYTDGLNFWQIAVE